MWGVGGKERRLLLKGNHKERSECEGKYFSRSVIYQFRNSFIHYIVWCAIVFSVDKCVYVCGL